MDSGIDSTESSNGSLEEGGVAAADVAMEGEAAASEEASAGEAASSCSDPGLPQPQATREAAPAALGTQAAAPSNLRTLAAAAVSSATPEAVEKHSGGEKAPRDSSALFKVPKAEFPEGSRLKLHFPLYESGNGVQDGEVTSCELEPPSGLTFANVSPSMCLSRGYEAYSQGYAVLPYENNTLQKKLKNLRLRMRQQHYQILSNKAKERKLRIAASLNNVETVEQLLREGVNPKVTDDKERSALHIAASKGYTDIAKLLLQHGADPNQRDGVGNTPLHLAACTSHIPTVTLLLKAGTDVRQPDNQGYSPLHLARSKLKLLQRDSNSSSQEIKKQVYQVIEMMQTYLECSGNAEEAELLTSFTSQLSLSDSRQQVESDLQALLNSLTDLSLVKSKVA
ncbi:ankyrin repeat domain-containing protein 54-like [Penaeus chinensis]|uniref:ankyrin repeat domain-containing protein 54-like n=1 Tax=Penaeus chinensis TaxID=139456 RepID=UPI001FB5E541|nr:ankyrin repeat domain-containing protein 54-like [Penaeus chinensis]